MCLEANCLGKNAKVKFLLHPQNCKIFGMIREKCQYVRSISLGRESGRDKLVGISGDQCKHRSKESLNLGKAAELRWLGPANQGV